MLPDAQTPHQAQTNLPVYIGKYKVLRRLGEGATSDVFLALDEFRQCEVAIKRSHAWTAGGSPQADLSLRFFATEAALARRLQHPNVVQILDALPDHGVPYLVMEYVPGATLKDFLPCRPLAAARSDRRAGFQMRDGLVLCLSPGPDPSRREAGQPAGPA